MSGSSSRSAGTTDNERSHAHSHIDVIAAEDDLQEFLDPTNPDAAGSNRDGDEHHDSHRLPASLRTMTALRQQNAREAADASAKEPSAGNLALNAPGAPNNTNPTGRANRERSGSHASALSSSSQSGSSSRGLDAGQRNSPGLAANYQALSIAEEHGLTSPVSRVSGPAARPRRWVASADPLPSQKA